MSTHKCPAPPCHRRVPVSQLACRDHWYAVPKQLRDRVWDAYMGRSSEDHLAVVGEAIEYLRERYPVPEVVPGVGADRPRDVSSAAPGAGREGVADMPTRDEASPPGAASTPEEGN